MRFQVPLIALLVVLPGVLALGGCPDTGGELDEFETRYKKIYGDQTVTIATGGCTTPQEESEGDGDYIFALSAKLDPKKAFVLRATIVTTENPDGGLLVDLTLQPLSKMDQMTPVCGGSLTFTDLPVAFDGILHWDLGQVTLCGDANPISVNDVITTLILDGKICGGDELGFSCGAASGIVSSPLPNYDLTGSTWTMQKIEGTPPAPVINCDKVPAEY